MMMMMFVMFVISVSGFDQSDLLGIFRFFLCDLILWGIWLLLALYLLY